MIKIQKDEFLEMLKLGILKTDRNTKNFTVTGKNKGLAARKHHYVCENDYKYYIRLKKKGGEADARKNFS